MDQGNDWTYGWSDTDGWSDTEDALDIWEERIRKQAEEETTERIIKILDEFMDYIDWNLVIKGEKFGGE